MSTCPRCNGDRAIKAHEGYEDDELLWTIYRCAACAFTWRDSEPPQSIDWNVREAWFRVDPENPERYPYNIPPAKPKS